MVNFGNFFCILFGATLRASRGVRLEENDINNNKMNPIATKPLLINNGKTIINALYKIYYLIFNLKL